MRRPSPERRGDVAPPRLGRWYLRTIQTAAGGVARLLPLALVLVVSLLAGCGGSSLRYADVLHAPQAPRDVAELIRPPSPSCLERASLFVRRPADILSEPLPPGLRDGTAAVLRGLHPVAKQVLRGTGGIWFARDIPEAAARFVPCDAGGERQGLILVDVASGLPAAARDVDLPHLYWQRLGGVATLERPADEVASSRDRGLRYVLLHEIGHALSLLSGEFRLGTEGQFEIGAWEGFLQFSWRARYGSADEDLRSRGGLVPTGLAFGDWRRIRRALDGHATWLAPGYRRPVATSSPMCSLVDKLPRAGFVTPAAAVAPTEDYAELFAHAILVEEGKIRPNETLEVTFAGCPTRVVTAPYFAPGVAAKRAYMERQLEL